MFRNEQKPQSQSAVNLGGRVAVIIIKVLILLSYDINIILSYK